MNRSQSGFTLIELIAVVVILGILAAVAIPKFVDLSSDARTAKVNAAAGALKSAAAMAHGKYLVNSTSPQTFEGVSVAFTNEYPDAASIAPLAGLNSPDYTVSTAATTTTVTVRANCVATYTAAGVGAAPTVATTTTGC